MKTASLLLVFSATLLSAQAALGALDVTVESFRDGNIPAGYADVSSGVQTGEAILVSEEPFLDYLIPNNSGSAGITAQKAGGQYIVDSTVAELPAGGANRLANPDRYHVPFEWTDGTPLPFGTDYYGVSWGGWTATEVATLTTRISFPTTEPVRIHHWFNDGWNYNQDGSGHDILDGHNLTVTLYDAVGAVKQRYTEVLPSGGAEDIFGDHRQFYTALINVSGHSAGDIVVISNEGGNVGFKGTAVARGTQVPPPMLEYFTGQWNYDGRLGWLYGYGGGWIYSPVFRFIFESYPWIYSPQHGWMLDYQADIISNGLHLFSTNLGLVWILDSNGGRFWVYGESRWESF
jgi:hypothetical protein